MEINLIRKEETTKADIAYYIHSLKDVIEKEEMNPLLLRQHLKAMEMVIEGVKEILRKACLKEANKYPEQVVLMFGAEFTKTETGVSWDFSVCGDPVLEDLIKDLEKAKALVKERESFLKALKSSETFVDSDSGELFTITPPVKRSTSNVSCSIK